MRPINIFSVIPNTAVTHGIVFLEKLKQNWINDKTFN